MIPNETILENGGGRFRWCDAQDSEEEEMLEEPLGLAEDEGEPQLAGDSDTDSELGWCTDDDHGYE